MYMLLCQRVYSLKHYGQLNSKRLSAFCLFCSVLKNEKKKKETDEIDVADVFKKW